MSQIRHCRICNNAHKFKIKGLLSYPKHFPDKSIHKYYQRLMKKFEEHNIQQVPFSDDHICYNIENDICEHCWLFMHQGFQCSKCQIYIHNNDKESKICTLCNAQYCIYCENPLELFSQNKLCQTCEQNKNESFGTPSFLISFFISLLIPCFACSFFLKKMIKTIERFQYSTYQYTFAIITFLIIFPFIYIISIIGFLALLIFKLSICILDFLQSSKTVRMISKYLCVYKSK
ncbi:unnamed protein product [Paramecium primaurelia]|uniref:Phorbol-ester/DAG-type domain-containing protein n=1 Tax=Paramecium primaurelia TaxID=5886 RepID=A0A8S1N2E5_PARPR|nr:unnamed protein product [Paramecium primaurelia]